MHPPNASAWPWPGGAGSPFLPTRELAED
jgi:hypothetical protein